MAESARRLNSNESKTFGIALEVLSMCETHYYVVIPAVAKHKFTKSTQLN